MVMRVFTEAAVHRSGSSPKRQFTKAAVHQSSSSPNTHKVDSSSNILFTKKVAIHL
jgi:hypothetical protein